jgi:hypothetical protein
MEPEQALAKKGLRTSIIFSLISAKSRSIRKTRRKEIGAKKYSDATQKSDGAYVEQHTQGVRACWDRALI